MRVENYKEFGFEVFVAIGMCTILEGVCGCWLLTMFG